MCSQDRPNLLKIIRSHMISNRFQQEDFTRARLGGTTGVLPSPRPASTALPRILESATIPPLVPIAALGDGRTPAQVSSGGGNGKMRPLRTMKRLRVFLANLGKHTFISPDSTP